MSRRRRDLDVDWGAWAGRVWIDWAYAQGKLMIIGDDLALLNFERTLAEIGKPGCIGMLRDQFAAGIRDAKKEPRSIPCGAEDLTL